VAGQGAPPLEEMQAALDKIVNLIPGGAARALVSEVAAALRAWRRRGQRLTDEQWRKLQRILGGILPTWHADGTGKRQKAKQAQVEGAVAAAVGEAQVQDAAWQMADKWRALTAGARAVRRTRLEGEVAAMRHGQRREKANRGSRLVVSCMVAGAVRAACAKQAADAERARRVAAVEYEVQQRGERPAVGTRLATAVGGRRRGTCRLQQLRCREAADDGGAPTPKRNAGTAPPQASFLNRSWLGLGP